MSNALDLIKERRTVRKFTDAPVPEDTVTALLEAVQWAQSWANTQCWEIVVIRDASIRQALQGTVPPGNPSHEAIVSAPVLLAVCAQREKSGYYKGTTPTKFGDWFMFDLGIVTQNIALAAWDMGLGSVVVGLFDQDAAAKVLRVPENTELVTLMPMGFRAETPQAPKRRAVQEFTHSDSF